jgi:hypothetical protein
MESKPAYTINELLTFHPAGRSKLYEDLAAGRLVARKIGDRTIILHSEYLAYLEALPRYDHKGEGQGEGA